MHFRVCMCAMLVVALSAAYFSLPHNSEIEIPKSEIQNILSHSCIFANSSCNALCPVQLSPPFGNSGQ
jgi:hypothetical protein